MMLWFGQWWRRRQRSLDLQLLWPSIREQAPSLEVAREAFSLHVAVDPAWQDVGPAELGRIVGGLK